MIRNYLVKRKKKKFIISVSQKLTAYYGRSAEYTEGQVKTALKKMDFKEDLENIAIGIFCNEKIAKAFGLDEVLIKNTEAILVNIMLALVQMEVRACLVVMQVVPINTFNK